jgi:hypothetical protein
MDVALARFYCLEGLRGQHHVKPMHQYISMRLVIEGGFLPEEIAPRPPLRAERLGSRWLLHLDEEASDTREETVLGGLKTKDVDVVVAKERVGPVVCVSIKGTGGAFRNLTNRMEEAVGDCTNLHMTYPALVYGFMHLFKCNRTGDPGVLPNDVSIGADGCATEAVVRYHDVLAGLTDRQLVRNDISRYEAVALLMVDSSEGWPVIFGGFPTRESTTRFEDFLSRIYRVYDHRFPYVAPSMKHVERVSWAESSPAFEELPALTGRDMSELFDYRPRLA